MATYMTFAATNPLSSFLSLTKVLSSNIKLMALLLPKLLVLVLLLIFFIIA